MTARPLPAYARELADARRRGMTLRNPLVSVALHWRNRPGLGYGVVVPYDRDPGEFDWFWVRGLEVLVVREGDAAGRVDAAVRAIAAARPKRLLVVDIVDPKIITIVRPKIGASEVQHVAA